MPQPGRRADIINILTSQNFCNLNDLAQQLGVSISTARRDLNDLEIQGVLKRTHGGVVFLGDRNSLPIFSDRQLSQTVAKNTIGKVASSLVNDDDTIIFDGGTTTYQVAVNLKNRKIQVVTNSLPVMNLFADSHDAQLVSTGGTLYPCTGVHLGPFAESTLKNINAQKAFLGTAGFTERGLFNSNALVVATEKLMLEASKEVYVVSDHTKFNRTALSFLCDYEPITAVITDYLPHEYDFLREVFTKTNTKLICANEM